MPTSEQSHLLGETWDRKVERQMTFRRATSASCHEEHPNKPSELAWAASRREFAPPGWLCCHLGGGLSLASRSGVCVLACCRVHSLGAGVTNKCRCRASARDSRCAAPRHAKGPGPAFGSQVCAPCDAGMILVLSLCLFVCLT